MWQYTEQCKPPENVLLDTTNSQGDVSQLKRIGNLFFVPDGTMCVYYVPKMWRLAQPKWEWA
jgi:hypothetical protein